MNLQAWRAHLATRPLSRAACRGRDNIAINPNPSACAPCKNSSRSSNHQQGRLQHGQILRRRHSPVQPQGSSGAQSANRHRAEGLSRNGGRGELRRVASDHEAGPHSHPWEQIFILLKGRVTLHVDDQVFQMEAGSVVRIPPDVVHWAEPPSPVLRPSTHRRSGRAPPTGYGHLRLPPTKKIHLYTDYTLHPHCSAP